MGECPTEKRMSEFAVLFSEHLESTLWNLQSFRRADLLLENTGYMVLVLIVFGSEADDVAYLSSPAHARFVAATKDLLIWPLLTRLFEMDERAVTV